MLNGTVASIVDGASARLRAMAPTPLAIGIGQRIRRLRQKKGLSQAALARGVGVTRSAVSQIESGTTRGTKPDNLLAYARELGVDVEELVHGENYRRRTAPENTGMVMESPSAPYLATLLDAEVELLNHIRSAGLDHSGREHLARRALALLRAASEAPTTVQRKPKH